jgi:hypothetical protein
MGILAAFFRGLGLGFRKGKVVLFVYLIQLVFAGVFLAPVAHLLGDELGRSPRAAVLERGLDFDAVVGLLEGSGSLGERIPEAFGYLALMWILVSALVTGGILQCLHHRNERASLSFFFFGCGRYAFRFLRLLVLAAIGFFVLVVVNALANDVLGSLLGRSSHEPLARIVMLCKVGLLGVLFLLLLMLLDFARIRIVVEGRHSVLGAFAGAIRFFFRHPLKTMGVHFLFLVLGWGVLAAYHPLANSTLDPSELYGLLALQQGFMLVRAGVRVAAYGGQLELFKGLGVTSVSVPAMSPPRIGPEPEESEPFPDSAGPPQPPDVPAPADAPEDHSAREGER